MRLNLDAGELDDETPELWAVADILHIACGGHAGDEHSMSRVVAFAAANAIAIGAHPSYPDRAHFGRRTLAIAYDALAASLREQCAALAAIARTHGARVQYLKPHGALYHDASRDRALADLVLDAAASALGPVTIVGPRGHLADAAASRGLAFLVEGFADRGLRPDGSLIPRGEPGALITDPDEAAAQARSLVAVDTICIHADTPNALAIAHSVKRGLTPLSSMRTPGDVPIPDANSKGSDPIPISSAMRTRTAAPITRPPGDVPIPDASDKGSDPIPSLSGMWTWERLGDRAIRFARPQGVAPRAIADAVRAWPGVVDVVVARHDIGVYFGQSIWDVEARIRELATLRAQEATVREHALRAVYDGPDLEEVARATGLGTREVIEAHAGATYAVDTIGFAPGFAYLVGLDARLRLPRRSTPRPRVPAGSLAIAAEHTAVYPFASPGGWHLIGRVDATLFGPDGALLQLGDRVRFVR